MSNDIVRPEIDELQIEMKDLASRDLQLWSIGALTLIVVATGLVTLLLPNLMWKSAPMQMDSRFLPQLVSGLIALLVLFNVYLMNQKRRLDVVRESVVKRLILNSARSDEPIDPLTKLLCRESVNDLLVREKSRADRHRSSVAFAAITIEDFKELARKFGPTAADHMLLVVAQILRTTFRGSDAVTRLGGDRFLVVMPETNRGQAKWALRRLAAAVEFWNASTDFQYKLALNAGISAYVTGSDIKAVVDEAMERAVEQADTAAMLVPHNWTPAPAQAAMN